MKKISYQGSAASFSEIAAEKYFRSEITCIGQPTFEAVFESLNREEVDYAIVPVENSLTETCKLLGIYERSR